MKFLNVDVDIQTSGSQIIFQWNHEQNRGVLLIKSALVSFSDF